MQQEKAESQSPAAGLQPAARMTQERSVELDIGKELEETNRSSVWKDGNARKVLIRYPDFQITLRAMKAMARIPEHHNPGRVSVQTVRGHIRMHVEGKVFDLPVGKALVMDRAVPHDVEAMEESAFLVTVAVPEGSVH